MQSFSEKATLKTAQKAEVADQQNLNNIGPGGGHDKSQMKTKTDLKLHAVSDSDPGYNSLDSDSGSPISSSRKPNMKMSDTKNKEMDNSIEQSIEQNLVDKIRRRAASIGEDPSTPASFLQLHLDAGSNNHLDDGGGIKKETSKSSVQMDSDSQLDENKLKEDKMVSTRDENDEIKTLANTFNKTLLIAKGPKEKRRSSDRMHVPQYHQDNLYAPFVNQFPPILSVPSRDDGASKPKRIYVPGGGVVSPGSNLKRPSSQSRITQNFIQDPRFQPATANQWNHNVDMMFHTVPSVPNTQLLPSRQYDVGCWPHNDDFTQLSPSHLSHETSVISVQNGNSNMGTVFIKKEPPSPLGLHHQYSPCPGYMDRSPEKSQAIKDIVSYLKGPTSTSRLSDTPSPSQSVPSPHSQASMSPCAPISYSAASPQSQETMSPYTPSYSDLSPNSPATMINYTQSTEQAYNNVFPDTPPPSVESHKSNDPNSPLSVMSCHSDDMPVSPPQMVGSPQMMEPVRDENMLGIMECEQEVNRLSIECLMEQDAEDKDTCLHVVVTQGRYNLAFAIAKKLSSEVTGALDIQNNLGQTPVFLATVVNMPCLVQDLITMGADPSIKDRSGRTPMHYAAMKGFSKIVRAIHTGLQKTNRLQDFDVDLKDYDGKTPLHYSIEHHERYETVFTAESQCATQTFVQNKELVSMLLYMNASTTGQDGKSGKTPLHYAVEHQKIDLIDMILENDQSCVNKQTFSGCTPLHLAVGLKAEESVIEEIVRRLMRNGADVSKDNIEKEKPIGLNPREHMAVRNLLSGRS